MLHFRFANKPGITPGKPLSIGSINDAKRIARIESRQQGVALNCQRLNMAGARLAIAFMEQGDPSTGRIEQTGKTVSIHLGGAR